MGIKKVAIQVMRMKKLEIQNYEEKNGCYFQNNVQMTNFVLGVKKIMKGAESVNYQLGVNIGNKIYTLNVTPVQIRRQKFLQELPVYIENETEFYRLLRKTIFEKEFAENEVIYQTGYNGLQKVNGRYMYVYTNGSLDKDGFRTDVYSGIKGMYFPKEAAWLKGQNEDVIENLFKEYNRNPEIFYPLFLTNIMAITNGYFRLIGEPSFMKLTLWIDGTSGSGKTELAKAAGRYTFSDEKLNRECVSVTGKRQYALKCLAESSGSTCILDDVKNERVRDRRNSVRNIVDDYIRSVFQGRLTDVGNKESMPEWFDACAIITGEYLDTNESQNARIMYLKADKFLKVAGNSDALRNLQENPMWLTRICGEYIQWFLEKMEERSFPILLKEQLKKLRDEEGVYHGINNAERLNENRNMLLMALELVIWYLRDMNMQESFVERFEKNTIQSIQLISDETFCLLGGDDMVMMKVIKNILKNSRIRKAYYYRDNSSTKWKYFQPYFWIKDDEDFVWIKNYGESMLEKGRESNGKYDGRPVLIIRERRLVELIQTAIQDLVKENQISSDIAYKLNSNMTKILRRMQIIYKQYRSDSKWGRAAVNYPIFSLSSEEKYDGDSSDYRKSIYYNETIYNVYLESVIQMNVEHPCIEVLKERLENMDELKCFDDVDYWEIRGIGHEAAIKVRRSFLDSKTLYNE